MKLMKNYAVSVSIFMYSCLCILNLLAMFLSKYDNLTILSWLVLFTFIITSCVLLFLIQYSESSFVLYFILFIFGIVYIAKIPMMAITGFDSKYYNLTLQTRVDKYDFELAILYIFPILISFVFIIVFLRFFINKKTPVIPAMISVYKIKFIFLFIFIYIIISSLIMIHFGVARMGTEGVSLPYGLSGILYYSRTIIIPLFLFYIYSSSLYCRHKDLVKLSVFLLFFLALNEIVVRASKAPLFLLLLQLTVIFHLINMNTKFYKLNKKWLLLIFVLSLSLWPVIEVYRTYLISGLNSFSLSDAYNLSDDNFLIFSLERLFQRLLGFSQFAGLVSMDADIVFSLNIFDDKFESISSYYTRNILGFVHEGHRSSPSLLGSLYFMFGREFMALGFVFYILIMLFFWKLSDYFLYLSYPIKSILVVEIFNTVMAGTFDSSFNRIVFTLFISVFINYFIEILKKNVI